MDGPAKVMPKHQHETYGTLHVVSTPIGNLEDITLRALRVLNTVSVIAAEKAAHTRVLCAHHGIRTRLTSYNQHNRLKKAPQLIAALMEGKDIALVTDAGTPGISDPGGFLINRAAAEGIRVTPVPGPSAVSAALSVSGFPTERFVFAGFLPNRSAGRKRALAAYEREPRTLVFFEAPHRLEGMLADLLEVLGDRSMVMLREMTKVFEEVRRGPVSVIAEETAREGVRGELTIVVEGCPEADNRNRAVSGTLTARIDELLDDALSVKDVALLLVGEEGFTYRRIYKECLARKRNRDTRATHGVGQHA